jgi:RNAse (barnase) inhibitor barstar
MSKLVQRLADAKRSGVYRARQPDSIIEAATGGSLDVVKIDLRAGVFESMARALDFPEWFGGNWDALEDCLADLSWRADAGRVLVLSNSPKGSELGALIDVLDSAAQYWAGKDRAFFAVLIDPAQQLKLPDLYRGA